MQISRELLIKAGILPKLRLGIKLDGGGVKSTGPHRVKVLKDAIIKRADPATGKEAEWVRYTIEEGEEKKVYDTRLKDKSGQLSYLVQRFAEIPEGHEVLLEMKKRGVKNYIQVTSINDQSQVEMEDEDEPEGDIARETMEESV
jgi:hypothetical protein